MPAPVSRDRKHPHRDSRRSYNQLLVPRWRCVLGRILLQPGAALFRRHLCPLIMQLLALFRRQPKHVLVKRARLLALLGIHPLETFYAMARLGALFRSHRFPALRTVHHALARLRLVVPAVTNGGNQGFALLRCQLVPFGQ